MQRDPPQHKGPPENGALALPGHFGVCLATQNQEPFPTWRYVMQIASLKIVAAIFVAGFLILPLAKQGRAQESPKQQMNVSDTQLRAFAKVYVEVEKIRQAYEPRLKKAKNPEEGKQIQDEAASKMQGALTKEGLTEESYTQIFEIARADEGLRNKLVEFINEERQKS
jgi:Na+-transporting NADH:ubiquinone oxidoreductase subunit NqrC